MLTRQMYRTLLLVICCSTSRTLANVNDSASYAINITPPNEHNSSTTNVSSVRTLTINEIHLQNATSAVVGVNLTLALANTTLNPQSLNHSDAFPTPVESVNILLKIHRTVTRSKDAVWATVTLTFICVLLLLAVAQSRMWKHYQGPESQGVPLPDFNERVLFRGKSVRLDLLRTSVACRSR